MEEYTNTHKDLSFTTVLFWGLLVELVLVSMQFIYLEVSLPDVEVAFTEVYMRETGFILFQVIGFFIFVLATYFLLRRLTHNKISKTLGFLAAAAMVELAFYLFMQADYQGAFLYSILDKLVAAVFGLIIYNFKDRGHKASS